MQGDVPHAIRQLLERLPQWLRTDLAAPDPALRQRAEESLAAMIVAAIGAADGKAPAPDEAGGSHGA